MSQFLISGVREFKMSDFSLDTYTPIQFEMDTLCSHQVSLSNEDTLLYTTVTNSLRIKNAHNSLTSIISSDVKWSVARDIDPDTLGVRVYYLKTNGDIYLLRLKNLLDDTSSPILIGNFPNVESLHYDYDVTKQKWVVMLEDSVLGHQLYLSTHDTLLDPTIFRPYRYELSPSITLTGPVIKIKQGGSGLVTVVSNYINTAPVESGVITYLTRII